MSVQTKINSGEIKVGAAMEWAACDAKGRLLLNKGTVIQSQQQLDALIERGLYRQPGTSGPAAPAPKPAKVLISPFLTIDDLSKRLRGTFSGLINKKPDMPAHIRNIAGDIHKMCVQDLDAALGAVQLTHDLEYVLAHPLHVAILCELLAEFLKYDDARRERLIVAALTANLGMLSLQATLHQQKEPLSVEQRQQIQVHPKQSANILRDAGVTDEQLLAIIVQHHERHDGTGYNGLKGDEILEEAKIIALADCYSAMVSPRGHRPSLSAKDCLKTLFMNKGNEHDETLSLIIIKLLGVFPPGSFVRLKNGETAVVTKRPVSGTWPIVKSILTSRGGPFGEPLQRDCNDEPHGIKELHMPDRLPPLNLSALWGYKN